MNLLKTATLIFIVMTQDYKVVDKPLTYLTTTLIIMFIFIILVFNIVIIYVIIMQEEKSCCPYSTNNSHNSKMISSYMAIVTFVLNLKECNYSRNKK